MKKAKTTRQRQQRLWVWTRVAGWWRIRLPSNMSFDLREPIKHASRVDLSQALEVAIEPKCFNVTQRRVARSALDHYGMTYWARILDGWIDPGIIPYVD